MACLGARLLCCSCSHRSFIALRCDRPYCRFGCQTEPERLNAICEVRYAYSCGPCTEQTYIIDKDTRASEAKARETRIFGNDSISEDDQCTLVDNMRERCKPYNKQLKERKEEMDEEIIEAVEFTEDYGHELVTMSKPPTIANLSTLFEMLQQRPKTLVVVRDGVHDVQNLINIQKPPHCLVPLFTLQAQAGTRQRMEEEREAALAEWAANLPPVPSFDEQLLAAPDLQDTNEGDINLDTDPDLAIESIEHASPGTTVAATSPGAERLSTVSHESPSTARTSIEGSVTGTSPPEESTPPPTGGQSPGEGVLNESSACSGAAADFPANEEVIPDDEADRPSPSSPGEAARALLSLSGDTGLLDYSRSPEPPEATAGEELQGLPESQDPSSISGLLEPSSETEIDEQHSPPRLESSSVIDEAFEAAATEEPESPPPPPRPRSLPLPARPPQPEASQRPPNSGRSPLPDSHGTAPTGTQDEPEQDGLAIAQELVAESRSPALAAKDLGLSASDEQVLIMDYINRHIGPQTRPHGIDSRFYDYESPNGY